MLTNAHITDWLKRTGDDETGEPVFTEQPGGPWPVAADQYSRQLKLGVRTIKTRLRVIGRGLPDIREGDRLDVEISGYSDRYQVIERGVLPGTTLGGLSLILS